MDLRPILRPPSANPLEFCRFCFSNFDVRPIFSTSGGDEDTQLHEQIDTLLMIDLKPIKNAGSAICAGCRHQLTLFQSFRDRSQNLNMMLEEEIRIPAPSVVSHLPSHIVHSLTACKVFDLESLALLTPGVISRIEQLMRDSVKLLLYEEAAKARSSVLHKYYGPRYMQNPQEFCFNDDERQMLLELANAARGNGPASSTPAAKPGPMEDNKDLAEALVKQIGDYYKARNTGSPRLKWFFDGLPGVQHCEIHRTVQGTRGAMLGCPFCSERIQLTFNCPRWSISPFVAHCATNHLSKQNVDKVNQLELVKQSESSEKVVQAAGSGKEQGQSGELSVGGTAAQADAAGSGQNQTNDERSLNSSEKEAELARPEEPKQADVDPGNVTAKKEAFAAGAKRRASTRKCSVLSKRNPGQDKTEITQHRNKQDHQTDSTEPVVERDSPGGKKLKIIDKNESAKQEFKMPDKKRPKKSAAMVKQRRESNWELGTNKAISDGPCKIVIRKSSMSRIQENSVGAESNREPGTNRAIRGGPGKMIGRKSPPVQENPVDHAELQVRVNDIRTDEVSPEVIRIWFEDWKSTRNYNRNDIENSFRGLYID